MLCGPTSLSTVVLVYAGCLVGAPVAATVIPARGERLSRLFCGVLGSAALALSNLAPALVHPMPAPHGPWSLAIPGAAAAVVVLVNLAGLALCRWFPDTAPRRHRNTHP